jgi:uncharacterized protein (DUF305 family)
VNRESGEPRRARWRVLVAVPVMLLVGGLAGFVGVGLASSDAAPTDTSAAAGFARDMQDHHAQAVEMAMVVRDRSDDAEIRTLAYDIALTQQHQIGQMYGWLVQWGLPQTSRSHPPMEWMSGSGHAHVDPGAPATPGVIVGESAMPGMATAEDLRRLAELTGRDAEVFFLELMIAHHRGGVQMAEAVLDQAAPDHVHRLAETIVTAQESEIAAMRTMLADRGLQQ